MSSSINYQLINDFIADALLRFIEFNTKNLNWNTAGEGSFILKLFVTIYNTVLALYILLFTSNIIFGFLITRYITVKNFFYYINLLITTFIFYLILFKLILTLKIENALSLHIFDLRLEFLKANPNLTPIESTLTFTTGFGDALLLLSVLVGILCIDLLGIKNLHNSISNISIFYLFNIFIITMITTNNLLIMFISFEFIFLPTMFFAYSKGYAKKVDKASEILFYWTLFGSFTVLVSLTYLYYKYNTLNYLYLYKKQFTDHEVMLIFITIILGFGVKIPIVPFHYWLLKVHVESPTAFSIFLSGFLVKSAFYCVYMLMGLFYNTYIYMFLMVWVLLSLIIGTWGLAEQEDFKKLIAWATIQEMSFMLLFLIYKQLFLTSCCVLFLLLHGIMSSFMFFLVDILHRRFKTRSIKLSMGLNVTCPKLIPYFWFLILLFSGFPLTVKFYLEWNLAVMLLTSHFYVLMFALFTVNVLGVLFFSRILLSLMYGSLEKSTTEMDIVDIGVKEKMILDCLVYLILILTILIYMF